MEQTSRRDSVSGIEGLSDDALVRLENLHSFRLVPFSTSTVWRKVRKGEFPAPIKISAGITAWRVGDIREWLDDPAAFCRRDLGGMERGTK
jgi:predicted DNA-binding transcriptional regulator AlpA